MAVKNVTFQVTANTTQATQELAKITRALDLIQKKATIKVGVDTTQATGRINNINSAITQLSRKTVSLKIDTKGATAEIKRLSDSLSKADKKTNITVQAQTSQARQALQGLLNLINQLKQRVTITVNTTALNNAQQQINNITRPRQVNFRTNAAQAQQQVGGLAQSVNFISQAVANSSTNFIRLRNVIARTGLALGGVAIAASVASLGRAAIKAASDYEVLRVAFTTFIGNATLAEQKIKALRQFAAETPFTVDEVFKASRTLLGYGVAANELIPIIKRLGDVAGGTGAPLERIALVFGQVRAAGRLYGQDLLQLINAGFNPLQEISRTTGKSFGQLKDEMRKGLVTFEQVNQAFITATSEGGKFFNLTNALANTTQGRLARLKEEWSELLRVVGEGLLPAFNALVSGGRSFIEFLRNLPKFINDNSTAITLLAGATVYLTTMQFRYAQLRAIVTARIIAGTIAERANAALTALSNGLGVIRNTLTGQYSAALVVQTVATRTASAAQAAFNAVVAANPLGLLLTILATVAAAYYTFGDAVDSANDNFIDANEAFNELEVTAQKATNEQTKALKTLVDTAKNSKKSDEERKAAIEQINKEYKTQLEFGSDELKLVKQLDSAYAILKTTISQTNREKAAGAIKEKLDQQIADVQLELLNVASKANVKIPLELITDDAEIQSGFKQTQAIIQSALDEANFNVPNSLERAADQLFSIAYPNAAVQAQYGADVKINNVLLERANAVQTLDVQLKKLIESYGVLGALSKETEQVAATEVYDPNADEEADKKRKDRLRKLKEFEDEYASLLDRIRKNNEDIGKQRIEFEFVNAADFEEEIVKLKQLDRINEDTVDREIDREISSIRRKEITEQQKNTLIQQLEIIRGQEQEKRAKDLEKRLYEIERDGLVERRKLANELGDAYQELTNQRLDAELDSLDKLRDQIDEFYQDIFDDNPFAKGRFIAAPRVEFGGTEFQFEDVIQPPTEALEKLKETFKEISDLGLPSQDTLQLRTQLIDDFNLKYQTTLQYVENEFDLQAELNKEYQKRIKQAKELYDAQNKPPKRQNIFQFSRGVQERGQEDPFVREVENSQREYFSLLSEREKNEVKRREDKRNAEIALLDENYALNLKAVNDEKKIKKDALDLELFLINSSSDSQAEKSKKTRLANIQYQIEIGNIEQGYKDLRLEIEKNIAVESDKGLKITKINVEAETEIDGIRKTFAERRRERQKKDTEAINENNEAQLAVIKEERDARIQAFQDITLAFLDFQKVFIDGQIQQTEAAISAQEKRVSEAQRIADKGNVILLKAEQERLDKLNRQRAAFVRQQQNLAAVEIAVNSAIAVAKAATQPGAPLTIVAILAAMAVGFAQARAQANAAATFAKGGYTGDGGKYQEAGTVHKGEFVITAEKTRQYRPLLEAIHTGRKPELATMINERAVVINNKSTDERLERIEKAIVGQKGLQLSIDENGINGIVSRITYKNQRINNRAR